jgi:hypothetical protein
MTKAMKLAERRTFHWFTSSRYAVPDDNGTTCGLVLEIRCRPNTAGMISENLTLSD